MLLRNILIKNVIATHGITDFTHSILYNNLPKLLWIQGSVYSFTKLVPNKNINDFLFFLFSVNHFKNDFPSITISYVNLPNYITTSFFLLSSIFIESILPYNIGSSIFILFMTFNHVPNHYKKNYYFIKKDEVFNFLVIMFFTVFVNAFADYYPRYFYDFYNNNVFRSLIISHCIYNDMCIKYKEIDL